jgi:tellurite resistance protein TehA-like permease
MTGFDVFIVLGFAALLGFQAWATVKVYRSDLFEREQKWHQAKLIWLVPLIGAMLVLSVMKEDDASDRKNRTHQRS